MAGIFASTLFGFEITSLRIWLVTSYVVYPLVLILLFLGLTISIMVDTDFPRQHS